MATTAELLVERLLDWGVSVVFGMPGDGINGIIEALRPRQARVRFVQVRHLAAQLAYPDRQCVAFVGDGGFTMLMGSTRGLMMERTRP